MRNLRESKRFFFISQIWVMAFCVTFVFTVTLSVFPAVTADVKTSFPGKWGKILEKTSGALRGSVLVSLLFPVFPSERYFISVCCFLVFNIHDWLGRTVTTWVQWVSFHHPTEPALPFYDYNLLECQR